MPFEGRRAEVPGHGLTYIDHLTHNDAPRPHEGMGRVLRAPVQLQGSALLRHRGQAHRPEEQGDDEPLRQDPHPDQQSSDDKSQIAEYLDLYHGEGIQHIALGTNDVYGTVDGMKKAGVAFRTPSRTYYDLVDKRLPNHGEQLAELKRLRILIDGATHRGAPDTNCCCRSSRRR